jgi:hypothetical protein
MKFKVFLLSAITLVLFVGCERSVEPEFNSAESFLAVQIVSPSNAATKGTQGGFTSGTADEAKINSANFYFYDAAGNFVVKGETLGALTTEAVGDNIERRINATIVLRNVSVLPDQMLIVLNLPAADDSKFNNKSLTQAQAAITNIYRNDVDSYIMTNSTYLKKDETPKIVCTTRDIGTYLETTETAALANPVTAYVERLAVKGNLTIKDAATTLGMPNVTPASFTSVQAPFQGNQEEVTIRLNGWKFSNLNKQSYYIKKIDDTWDFTWNWSDYTGGTIWGGKYRTFWAQDANYTDGVYPTSYSNFISVYGGNADAISLTYLSYNDVAAAAWLGADYCHENTIAGDLLTDSKYKPAATNILLAAQVKLATAGTYTTLYRFNGVFYDWAQYSALLAENMNTKGHRKTGNLQYDAGDFQLPDPSVGTTHTHLYDGKIKPLLTDAASLVSTNEAKNYLADDRFITEVFTDGKMYYSISIEHFLNPDYTKNHATTPFIVGDFGVVRNHWYQVTVTDIKHVGTGVFKDDEPIVPHDDPSTRYLAAKINILAWQIVTQNVEL